MSFQSVVDEYASVSAKRKAYKKKEDKLRDKLIPFLRKHKCPANGPYLVSLTDVERSEFSWETFARKQLKKLGKTVKEIKLLVKREKDKAEDKIVPTLHVEINPDWKD